MKSKLSACVLKHEAFVLALLSGMTAADAARKAGYGRKNINVRIVAWELLQRGDIQRRLREVAEVATDEAILTVIQIKIILSNMIRENDRPLECIDLLNRMECLYSSKKPMAVQLAPITSVSVLQSARAKIVARIERQESVMIEDGNMDSELTDLCSEEQDTKNSEVTHGTRKSGTIFPTQIG